MRRRAFLLGAPAASLAVLAACNDDLDQAGNPYPPQCKGDLSDVPADITFMDPVILQAVNAHPGQGREEGLWIPATPPNRDIIWVDESLRGWKRDDAIRHERCHSRMHQLTGNGQWHK